MRCKCARTRASSSACNTSGPISSDTAPSYRSCCNRSSNSARGRCPLSSIRCSFGKELSPHPPDAQRQVGDHHRRADRAGHRLPQATQRVAGPTHTCRAIRWKEQLSACLPPGRLCLGPRRHCSTAERQAQTKQGQIGEWVNWERGRVVVRQAGQLGMCRRGTAPLPPASNR